MTNLPEQILDLFPDSSIDHYNIVDVIGEGGQGIVLKLENGDGRVYTGKLIQRRLSLTPYNDLRDLRRGIEISAYLHHDGIQTVKEVIDKDKFFVVVKEYAQGKSLRELIDEEGHLTPEELYPIVEQTVGALQYLHDDSQHPEVGVVCHRDIKPEHIMIGDDGKVTLIDIDTMKPVSAGTTRYTAAGTKLYQSLEALLGSTSTDGDFYALGFTAVEALLGSIPNDLSDSRLSKKPYSLPEWVSKELKEVVERMVYPEREERYHNARDILRDISLEDIIEPEIVDETALDKRKSELKGLRADLSRGMERPVEIVCGCAVAVIGGFLIGNPIYGGLFGLAAGGIIEGINRAVTLSLRKKIKNLERKLHLDDLERQYGKEIVPLEERRLTQEANVKGSYIGSFVGGIGGLFNTGLTAYSIIERGYIPILIGLDMFTIGLSGFLFYTYRDEKKKLKLLEDRISTAKLPKELRLGEDFSRDAFSEKLRTLELGDDTSLHTLDGIVSGVDVKIPTFDYPSFIPNSKRELHIILEGNKLRLNYIYHEVSHSRDLASMSVSTKEEFDNVTSKGGEFLRKGLRKLKEYSPEVYGTLRAMLPNQVDYKELITLSLPHEILEENDNEKIAGLRKKDILIKLLNKKILTNLLNTK